MECIEINLSNGFFFSMNVKLIFVIFSPLLRHLLPYFHINNFKKNLMEVNVNSKNFSHCLTEIGFLEADS